MAKKRRKPYRDSRGRFAKKPRPKRLPQKPARRQGKRKGRPKGPRRATRPQRPPTVEPAPLAGDIFPELPVAQSLLDFIREVIASPEAPVPDVRWTPPPEADEEYGFNLRDAGVLDPAAFVGRDEVTMSVVVTKFEDGRPIRTEHVVTFEPGPDEQEFWYNYHAALRELMGDVGSDVSISVTGMTA